MMSKPRFVLSKQTILDQYKKVQAISDVVSYSSKTNPLVTSVLEKETEDCMFSIHMKNELENLTNLSRVLFLAQGWDTEDIHELITRGIRSFVVDNEQDLDILLSYLETSDVKITLLLRIKLKENTLRTEKYFVFGMPCEVVCKYISKLKNHSHISRLGVHFHRKTQNMAEWNLIYDIESMLGDSLKEIDLLCIGGGLPSDYANTNIDVIQSIFIKIQEAKHWLNQKNIQLMVEPGRFIAAPAGKLITQIIRVHENTIIVNASVYNSDLDALIVPVKLLVKGEYSKENRQNAKPFFVKGITPCSMDLFRYRVYLDSATVKEGNELTFLNAGAYNFHTDFCNLEKISSEIE